MDIFSPVVSDIVRSFVEKVIRHAHYAFQFSEYVKNFAQKNETLHEQRDSVHDRATKAEHDAQKVDILVTKWLDKANSLLVSAALLEEKAKANQSCCLGHCPNWIRRHRLAKQMEKMMEEMVEQVNNCKFELFARPATPPGITIYSSEDFLLFESMKPAYDQLLNALKDDNISKIGLWGMGGCGKTTLAKQVGMEVKQHFNKVVFVAVSNVVNVQDIQDSIASQLGPSKLEGHGEQRRQSLWLRLNSGERILIIMDDVWERLDFEAIGIPFHSNFKRCKVLLTTRRERVCTSMDCQKTIHLETLKVEESWRLFQHYAQLTDISPDNLKDLAREIVHECEGLAIAIATVGSTLKGKNLYEWEEALETLRDDRWMEIEEGLRHPYKCLKLSYDNLNDEEAKSIFLLCSVFPEDSEIHEEDLVRYGIGLGLFEKYGSFKRARRRSSMAKDKLIDSCLLMKTNNEQCVKMHDLVRDVALRIAKDDHWEIVGRMGSQEAFKEDRSMKQNTLRYLWLDEVKSFPCQVDFSKLRFLRVCLDLDMIVKESFLPFEYFEGMLELRVLVLDSGKYYPCSSEPFHLPSSLRCLHLEGWKLSDLSFLGSLERLQSLTLRKCSFNELANVIIELKSLRLLDVRGCRIEISPYEMIGRCSKLEELYFTGNRGWKDEHECAANVFGIKGIPPVLQRYCIEFGSSNNPRNVFGTSLIRGLYVEDFDSSTLNETIKDLVGRAEILYLLGIHGGCKNIIPEMIQKIGGMKELTKLVLDNSEHLEFFADKTNSGFVQFENVFSKLTELQIKNMNSLGTFYRDMFPETHQILNLCNLKVLKFYGCPLLTHVFTFAVAETLEMLEVLEVDGCNGLKHILADEIQLNQQRSNLVFQKLKQLSVSNCEQMEYVATTLFAQGLEKLEELKIHSARMLKCVFTQSNQEGQNHKEFRIIELPCLNRLALKNLPNLTSIFPENYCLKCSSLMGLTVLDSLTLSIESFNYLIDGRATSEELRLRAPRALQSVKTIMVGSCPIQCVFQPTELPFNTEPSPFVSSLETLLLATLSELRYISKGPPGFVRFENLRDLFIFECRELRCIFPLNIGGSLSELKYLRMKKCDKLEQIVEVEESFGSMNTTSISSAPPPHGSWNTGSFNFCSLVELEVRQCPLLKSLFTQSIAKTLTSLEYLTIEICQGLQYIIKEDEKSMDDFTVSLNSFALPLPGTENSGSLNFRSLQTVSVRDCPLLKSLFTGSFNFSSLRILYVRDCPLLKSLFTGSFNFSSLQTLDVIDFPLLESLFTGSFNFFSLGILKVRQCPLLKSLFTQSIAKTLTSLKYLTIEICHGLQYIIKEDEKSMDDFTVSSNSFALPLPGTENSGSLNFRSLQTVSVRDCPLLKSLFTGSFNFSSLRTLYVIDCPLLKSLFTGSFNFCSLVELEVRQCPLLKSLFTQSIAKTLASLEYLTIEICHGLQYIIKEDEKSMDDFTVSLNSFALPLPGTKNSGSFNFSSLQTLGVIDCPLLKSLFTGSFNICNLQRLQSLTVSDCPLLKSLFSRSTAKTLTSLETLIIMRCGGLQYVIEDERVEGSESEEIVHDEGQAILPKLGFLGLKDVPNLIEVYRGFKWQSLFFYEVENCPKLTKRPEDIETGSEDEKEEEMTDSEDKAVEENKLVPYDLNKAGKR